LTLLSELAGGEMADTRPFKEILGSIIEEMEKRGSFIPSAKQQLMANLLDEAYRLKILSKRNTNEQNLRILTEEIFGYHGFGQVLSRAREIIRPTS